MECVFVIEEFLSSCVMVNGFVYFIGIMLEGGYYVYDCVNEDCYCRF